MDNYDLMNDNQYSSPSITYYRDNNSIHIVKRTPQKGIKIKFSAGPIGIAILIIIGVIKFYNHVENTQQYIPISEEVVETDSIQSEEDYTHSDSETFQVTGLMGAYESTGLVFPDSSERLLTDNEIMSLGGSDNQMKLDLVQHAINEIYARNGYDFKEKAWRDYYNQFDWYKSKGLSDKETVDRFNTVEHENVNKLRRIRDRLKESYS